MVKVYANSHYVTPKPTLKQAVRGIKEELKQRLDEAERAQRCWRRSGSSSALCSIWR